MNTNNNRQKNKAKGKKKARIIGRKQPINRRLRNNRQQRGIPAASTMSFKKKFTVLRQNGNSVRVTGRDLIYSIPDDLTSPIQSTNVITVIPANPAYWKGTRIAALASGYQNYRPISFKITYIPMCAVTQQGNVIGGTIWDDGIDNNNLQQSLRTSNGGFLTQCYVPHTTKIRPKTNLQFNLYRMGGSFSTTSNPFIFIALAIGCKNLNNQRITPGYFYVTWSFELKNPIGSINTYNNSGLIQYSNIIPEMNTTVVNIDPTSDVPFGAFIDIEQQDNELKAYYNDTPIEIAAQTPTWAFTTVTKTSNTRALPKIPIVYDGLTTSEVRLQMNEYIGFIISDEHYYNVYIMTNMNPGHNYRFTTTADITYLLADGYQNFGERQPDYTKEVTTYYGDEEVGPLQATFLQYRASKTNYAIKLVDTTTKDKRQIKPIQAQLPIVQEQLEKLSVTSQTQ